MGSKDWDRMLTRLLVFVILVKSLHGMLSEPECCEYKQSHGNKDPGKDGVYHLLHLALINPGTCINNCLYTRLGDTNNTVFCFAPSHAGQAPCVEEPEYSAQTTGVSLASHTEGFCRRHKLGPVQCGDGPDQTYYADPTACERFYQCAGGRAVLKRCQVGLLWNDWEGKKICDWPDGVDCCNGTGKYRGPCWDKPDNSFLPHPVDCKKFYHCDRGHPVEKTCGPGTLWNNVIKACDWPHNVNCNT